MKFGLLGKSLSHSLSADYHNGRFRREKINAEYCNFEIDEVAQFKDLISHEPSLLGLNVTVPYKKTIIPFLDELSKEAESVGAVNTIVIKPGRLSGFNTDIYGFNESLRTWINKEVQSALVLGTGGSAHAVAYALESLSIKHLKVSRAKGSGDITYDQLDEDVMQTHELIINTTPLGMHPDVESMAAIPMEFITQKHWVYDLVYNPEKSILLRKCEQSNANIKNGLQMLHMQADRSWNIWKSYFEETHGKAFD